MKKRLYSKACAVGIFVLLVVTIVLPGISGNINKINIFKNVYLIENLSVEEWNKTFGGTSYDGSYTIQQTTDEGYVLVGYTRSFGAGDFDIWLIKTDSDGNHLWNKTFGGTSYDYGRSVHQTTDEGYIIVGYTFSFGAGEADVWLIKTDSDGNKLWDKTFGGIKDDRGYSVRQTVDGGYIITGHTRGFGTGGANVWLIKTDNNGNHLWNKSFGGTGSQQGFSVQPTIDEGFIITGYKLSIIGGNTDVWLIKTDSNGNHLWNKTFGGTNDDYSSSVMQTTDGGFVIIGGSSYSLDESDVWLIKTDSNGNHLWNRTFGGEAFDFGWSVQQTSDEGYILTGGTESYSAGEGDIWLIKTDKNGNHQWNKTFGGTAHDWGHSIQHTSDEGYIITGYTNSYGAGESDVWLIKIKSENQPPDKPTINGPTNGRLFQILTYEISAIDTDGDDIAYYLILWGDDTHTNLTGPFASGESLTASHRWVRDKNYTILARATDVFGKNSYWGELDVSIPRTSVTHCSVWQRFLDMFPILQKILDLFYY